MVVPSRPDKRPSLRLRLRLALLAFASIVALGCVEVALHLAPGLLPTWFRERHPPHGVEFAAPGVLDRTPITAVPLPYGVDPYDGPPPHDLVDYGVAPRAGADADRAEVPRLVLPADADGLPNAERPARPALALVGDSFTVFGAQQEPPGLQRRLAERLGVGILNASISGIGPDQELFLLEHVVLPSRPKLVVWLFFGGNDVIDAFWSQAHRGMGIDTWGELHADRRAPRWIVPSLLAGLFAGGASPLAEPQPGFVLQRDPARRLWFYPDTLRVMAMSPALLTTNPGWSGIRAALARAHTACAAAGARLLVVYVPSKEQVYGPRVVADPAQLQRFVAASTLQAITVPADAGELAAAVLQNRGAIEATLQELCVAAGLQYWSATSAIEAIADAGPLVYYAADSHWRAEAQIATAEALAEVITARGLLPR